MPGENCSIVGCGASRRIKGIGIFRVPSAVKYKEWRTNWLSQVTKSRVIDSAFREQIENDRVYVCEKHFNPEDIEIRKIIFLSCIFQADMIYLLFQSLKFRKLT